MSNEDPVKGWRVSQWLPTAGIAFATPVLVWFSIGDLSFRGSGGLGLFHDFGPYEVGPESGYVVGGMAAVVAAAAVAVLVIWTRRGVADRRSWAVVGVLAGAGALAAAGWRIMTAGVIGANIGGGFVLLIGPVLIAGLLVGAVRIAGVGGRLKLDAERTRLLTLAAVLVVPALYAGLFALGQYDAAAGFITARQYADVRIGQTRPAVHEKLGRDGAADFAVLDFPPVAAGLLCDYYVEVGGKSVPLAHAYQFCFRAGVLVSKDLSVGEPYAN
jgi:hypothetical protein